LPPERVTSASSQGCRWENLAIPENCGPEPSKVQKVSDWLWPAVKILLYDPMGSLKKRRKAKINKHKRRKKLRLNRHKKRTWQK
jgi:hypothetical protein